MLGGVFPLVTQVMFKNLGYPAASSLLGGIVGCYETPAFCFDADLV